MNGYALEDSTRLPPAAETWRGGSSAGIGVTISVTVAPHSPHIPRNGMQSSRKGYVLGESVESGSCGGDLHSGELGRDAFPKPRVVRSIRIGGTNFQ